ncbi:MAG: osmotically inducible protein C [Burkholderiales bacterium 21-58-4]|nr:MAG: osmotically inducible protein C [Burkholderiales bacterium 21-58-4]
MVVSTNKEHFRTEVYAGSHHLLADEPKDVGGTDAGPSPYGYLTAALGACTAITVRMYADRKQWPLDSVMVRLTHAKIHAEDCADCDRPSSLIDKFERQIELRGVLSPEQKQRLMEIADKCPVHKTLQSKVQIETRLKQ